MNYYICSLKAKPVNPYIDAFQARSKTAAARLFLESRKGYRIARKSTSCVQVNEITKKLFENRIHGKPSGK